jgi:hypothetical protein
MKIKHLLFSFIFICASIANAQILNENFNHGTTAGNLTTASSAWVAHSGAGSNPVVYQTNSLTFANYGSSNIGGSAFFGNGTGTREDVNLAYPATINSGSVYHAFLMKVDTVAGTGDYNVHALVGSGATGGAFFNRVYVRPGAIANTVDFGFAKNATSQYGVDDAIPYGTTVLIVMKHTFTAVNDTASFWIFTSTIPSTEPTPTIIDGAGADPSFFGSIGLRQGSTGYNRMSVDGIRIADNWTDALGILTPANANPATNLTNPTATSSSLSIAWTLPTGYQNANNEILVFAKPLNAVTLGTPAANPTTYTANAAFGQGTAYENDAMAFCVYKGDASSVTVTGLLPSTNYHFLVYNVRTTDNTYSSALVGNFTTSAPPTLPVVGFGNTTLTFAENAGLVTVTANVSNANGSPVAFQVAIVGGTASSADHNFVSPFQGGAPANFNGPLLAQFNIIDDNLVEGDETVTLIFQNPVNCVIDPAFDTLVVTITDNDFSSFAFSMANYTANEGVDSAEVFVRYINPGPLPTSVRVNATPGTALQGPNADYVYPAAGKLLTFNGPADTLKVVRVFIVDRRPGEPTESFTMALANPTNNSSLVSPSTATVTIIDRANYPYYPIGQINTVNANGVADSLNKRYEGRGIVYGVNMRPSGIQITIRDNSGGIGVFNNTGNFGYTVNEGDSIHLVGAVRQFNGLTQFDFIDTLFLVATGRPINAPRLVTAIDESTESDLVYFQGVTVVDPNVTVWPANQNVDITDGTNVFQVRIDGDTDVPGTAVPSGPFNIIGIGGQFDSSNPFTSGYQLFPRRFTDVFANQNIAFSQANSSVNENAGTHTIEMSLSQAVPVVSNFIITKTSGDAVEGTDFSINGSPNFTLNIGSTTAQLNLTINNNTVFNTDKTATFSIENFSGHINLGANATHTLTIINDEPNSINELSNSEVTIFPNPTKNQINLKAAKALKQVELYDITGKSVLVQNTNDIQTQLNIQSLQNGVYFVRITLIDNSVVTNKFTKN